MEGNIFDNKQFVFDLPLTLSFKEKQELKQKIIEQKGIVSYTVNKNSDYVIRHRIDDNETYRSRRAKNYGIPCVSCEFIEDCVKEKKIVDYKKYILDCSKANVKKDFSDGKIQIQNDGMSGNEKRSLPFRFSAIKVYDYKDENGPAFHFHKHTIAKATLLRGKKKKNQIPFCILEIHVSKEDKIEEIPKYCVFMHNGIFSPETKVNENKLCRYFNDINETMLAYNHLYKQYISPPHSMTQTNKLINTNIGSDLLCSTEWLLGPLSLDPQVKYLINHIWNEAVLDIEDKLSVSLKMLSFDKIETAMMLIWKILCNFQEEKEEITKLWKEFYEVLPHKNQNELETVAKIKEKFLDCQLISDMMAASECFENKSNTTVEEKYQALHCNIETLTSDNAEYHSIISQFAKSNSVIIDNIYKLNHYVDSSEYDGSIGNEKMLLHPTKVKDLIGLLPRGLSDFDECYLHGDEDLTHRKIDSTAIYFVDTIEGLLKYTPPSRCCGTRMIIVNKVALGNCNSTCVWNDVKNSENYDSVHCISRQINTFSEFNKEEYVILDNRRQQMKYLIEFHLADDVVKEMTIADEGAKQTSEKEDEETLYATTKNASVDLNQFLNQSDKEIKLKSQLKAEGMPVHLPLKSVHVRASLIDLASEVTVIQEFINNHSETIQGKYIFPLSEKAAVCGFEAFTEGRHFVGRIEEKTEAHQEYHEAVRAGRKAYLMDEESPEVFSVTIGNISTGAVVLIKITYVSELELEGDLIKFLIPESITPVQEQDNIIDNKQLITEANDQKSTDAIQTSIEIFLDMPFPIRLITSYTHKLNVKKTETKAVVKINPNDKFSNGFHMLVGLTEIHSPRMWVEESTSNKTEACMIAFYPEFDIPTCEENEIIIALDASNSMQGECFANAQIISLLCLHFLPENCKFNVIKFGTVFQELFPIAVTKSLDVVQDAQRFVLFSIPEMGNSNIRHLLHSYYLLPPPINTTRNIFLISDGFFNCPNELFSVAAKHRHHTRIFTFGIGPNFNNHLLRGLSISGGGGFERFDNHLKHKWESHVKKLIDMSIEPVLVDVIVDWQTVFTDEELLQAPCLITSVFNGARLIVYRLTISSCSLVSLTANIKGQELSSFVYASELAKTKGNTVHRLTTRALVEDWAFGSLHLNRIKHEIMKRNLQPYVIELSKSFGIVTPLTSFVAVEGKDESSSKHTIFTINDILETVNIDQLPYLQYGVCDETCDAQYANVLFSGVDSSNADSLHLKAKNCDEELESVIGTVHSLSSGFEEDDFMLQSKKKKKKKLKMSKVLSCPLQVESLSAPIHDIQSSSVETPSPNGESLKEGNTVSMRSLHGNIPSPSKHSFSRCRSSFLKTFPSVSLEDPVLPLHSYNDQMEGKIFDSNSPHFHISSPVKCRSVDYFSLKEHEGIDTFDESLHETHYPSLGNERNLHQRVQTLSDVENIMRNNVEKVLERDIKLSELDDRADYFEQSCIQTGASEFQLYSCKLKKRKYPKLVKPNVDFIMDITETLLSSVKEVLNALYSNFEEENFFKNHSVSLSSGLPFVNALLKNFPQKPWMYKDISLFSLRRRELIKAKKISSKEMLDVISFFNEMGGIDLKKLIKHFLVGIGYNIENDKSSIIESVESSLFEIVGIQSLSKPIQTAVASLLLSLMFIVFICVGHFIPPDLIPFDLNDPNEQAETIIEKLFEEEEEIGHFMFYALLKYITMVNRRFPLIYHKLELGNSWEAALDILLKKIMAL